MSLQWSTRPDGSYVLYVGAFSCVLTPQYAEHHQEFPWEARMSFGGGTFKREVVCCGRDAGAAEARLNAVLLFRGWIRSLAEYAPQALHLLESE